MEEKLFMAYLIRAKKVVFVAGMGLLIFACAGTTKRRLFSPSESVSTKVWHQGIHGGASLSSPADGIFAPSVSDSNYYLLLFSEPIKERLTWIGLLYPFIPTFWTNYKSLSRSDDDEVTIYFHSNLDIRSELINKPIVYLTSNSKKIYGDIVFEKHSKDSSVVMCAFLNRHGKREYFKPSPTTFYRIEFKIKNSDLDEFDLNVEGFVKKSKQIEFKKIHFKKVWTSYEFMGP